jgi:hypothetical protein
MTERRIDPSNYLDLAGGREDLAVELRMQDEARAETLKREFLIDSKITPMLGSLTTEQLSVVSTTVANMVNVNIDRHSNG